MKHGKGISTVNNQVYYYHKMVRNMKDHFKMILNMDLDGNTFLMVHIMKGIIIKENHMDKVNLLGLMENIMMENGYMV